MLPPAAMPCWIIALTLTRLRSGRNNSIAATTNEMKAPTEISLSIT